MPDAAVLLRLSELARVPVEQREFFFESVRGNVQTACELDALAKGGQVIKKGATLLRAARELYEVLGNLNEGEREFMEGILASKSEFIFEISRGEGLDGLRRTAFRLVKLLSLVTGSPPPRYPHQGPQSRQRGRRLGQVKNWIFQDFVFDVLTSTATVGGELVHDKNRPGTSLSKAIRMLAPHLPDGFLPKRLPRSTLQRLQTRYNKIKADLDDLENASLPPAHPT